MARENTSKNEKVSNFILNSEGTYPFVCTGRVPTDKGRIKMRIKATFRHLGNARRVELLNEYRKSLQDLAQPVEDGETADIALKALGFQGAMLKEAIVHLEWIMDPNGVELPYSDELKDKVLDNDHARNILLEGFGKSLQIRDDVGN